MQLYYGMLYEEQYTKPTHSSLLNFSLSPQPVKLQPFTHSPYAEFLLKMSTKLYYFDARGICEPIRMILSYGGIEFEDIRAPVITFPPSLPSEVKSSKFYVYTTTYNMMQNLL